MASNDRDDDEYLYDHETPGANASQQPEQSHDDLIQTFCEVTRVSPSEANAYLSSMNWDYSAAVHEFFTHRPDDNSNADITAETEPEPEYSGPRTLDGRPAPHAVSSSSAAKKAPKKKGLATLSSLGGGHDHDDDDDDEEDDDEDEDEARGPRDLFAGGKKSGLAVQDPAMGGPSSGTKKVIKDIIAQAKANAGRSGEDDSEAGPSRPSRFHGSGQTLGGEGVPSRTIPNQPSTQGRRAETERQAAEHRVLHLWADGFSIDDGELRRFDDPNHASDLNMIRQGRAPLHLMNVSPNQTVDVKLEQHAENWHQLPRIYRPFGGQGRRLGSPVPGEAAASLTVDAAPAASPATTSQTSGNTTLDESQPTLMIRIQLPDGTRLPARFNTTHTVEEIYQFVQRASPQTRTRDWVLATTFPNKEHRDRNLVLGEMAEFKRGGTAIVKWT